MSKKRTITLQQIVKGSGFVFIGQIIAFFVAFLYQVFVARYLGPELFGVLSLGIVIMSIGAIFVKLGLPLGINRYIALYSEKKDKKRVKGVLSSGFIILLISSLAVAGVCFLFSGLIADKFLHSQEHLRVVQIFIISIPFAALINIFYELFLGFKRPICAVIVDSFLHKTLRFLGTMIFIFLGMSLFGISIIYLVGLAIAVCLSFLLLQKTFPFFSLKIKSIRMYRPLLAFSLPLFFADFLGLVFGWGDSMMIGYFLNPAEVGIYRIAFSLTAFLNVFLLSFEAFFYPVMTCFFARKNIVMIKSTFIAISRLIFLTTFPVFLIFVFFSSSIINIFFGNSYVSGSISLIVLSFGCLFSVFLGPVSRIIQVFGKTKFLFKIQALTLLLNLVLNFFLIPVLGITGAALTTALTMMLSSFFCWLKVKSLVKIKFIKWPYIKYVFSGLVSIGIIRMLTLFVPVSTFFVLMLTAAVFLVFYFLILILVRAFNKDDLMLIRATEEKIGIKSHWVSRLIEFRGY